LYLLNLYVPYPSSRELHALCFPLFRLAAASAVASIAAGSKQAVILAAAIVVIVAQGT